MIPNAALESVLAAMADPAQAQLPRHARLQRALRQLMLDGALLSGQALPASRVLARSLGLSRDTVELAYGQLQAEGFIDRQVGRGSFVSARTRPLGGSQRAPVPRPGPDAAQALPRLSRRGAALWQGGGVHDFVQPRAFAPGVPETRAFPFATWERLRRQALQAQGSQAWLHAPPQGLAPLREAIAQYLNLERGARATPERVLVLTSAQQALALCASVLLDAGEHIALEDPAYPGARKAFEAAGLVCLPLPLDARGLRVEALQAARPTPRAVFVTPSHQFPSGATLALERRLALIEWARREQAWIIEDDYDSEFHYEGRPTACVQGLDAHQRTIYIGTFSKSLFPGLRLAYMVLPPGLVEPMARARTLQDGHSAPLPQLTLARFIDGGHFGAHVRAMRAVYAERRDALAQLLHQHLRGVLEVRVPAGGLQMPCWLTRPGSEALALRAAGRAGIQLQGLSVLHQDPGQARAGFLMGFAAYAPHEQAEAVRQLAAVLDRMPDASPDGLAQGLLRQ